MCLINIATGALHLYLETRYPACWRKLEAYHDFILALKFLDSLDDFKILSFGNKYYCSRMDIFWEIAERVWVWQANQTNRYLLFIRRIILYLPDYFVTGRIYCTLLLLLFYEFESIYVQLEFSFCISFEIACQCLVVSISII